MISKNFLINRPASDEWKTSPTPLRSSIVDTSFKSPTAMKVISMVILSCLALDMSAQQVPDSSFRFTPESPAYPKGKGPVVHVDEAHNNFHTLGTRYYSFGEVLKNDGYRPQPFAQKFSDESLRSCKIIVIANALSDTLAWVLPTRPAFTDGEATALKKWVENGGALFLIADHMPCPGAVKPIGKAFGINLYNGYALYNKDGQEIFTRAAGTLKANAITNGRNPSERVDSIAVFTGHAFLPLRPVEKIIEFNDDHSVLFPNPPGDFREDTPSIDASGLMHSVYFTQGKGRVVIVGEAAMFSAQLAGPNRFKAGMNEPAAKYNPQLLLNIIHYLDGVLN